MGGRNGRGGLQRSSAKKVVQRFELTLSFLNCPLSFRKYQSCKIRISCKFILKEAWTTFDYQHTLYACKYAIQSLAVE